MLRSVGLSLVTDVSGQPVGPIFKGQAAPRELIKQPIFYYLILEYGTHRVYRNVGNNKPTLGNIQKAILILSCWSHWHYT